MMNEEQIREKYKLMSSRLLEEYELLIIRDDDECGFMIQKWGTDLVGYNYYIVLEIPQDRGMFDWSFRIHSSDNDHYVEHKFIDELIKKWKIYKL